jgi:hypothetical protein
MLARITSVLLLAGGLVVMSAARAEATLIIYVCGDASCSGGATVFTDQLPGDTDPTLGSLNFSIDGIASGGASSYPASGSPDLPFLNLRYSFLDAGFTTYPTPYIFATQDLFTTPGNADFEADASNGGGEASLYAGLGTFLPPAGAPAFSCLMDCAGAGIPVGASPSYYLAIGIAPTAQPGFGASGDATARVTPQQTVPDGGSTAALLGSILLGFGMLRRKFNV